MPSAPMKEVQVAGVTESWSPGVDHPRVICFRASAGGMVTLGEGRKAMVKLTYTELADLLGAIPASLLEPLRYAQMLGTMDTLRKIGSSDAS